MIEYHGWIVLYSTNRDWSDTEWDATRVSINSELSIFLPEAGHAVGFAETTNSMQTIFLHGYIDSDINGVFGLFHAVARIAPESYGELLVLEDHTHNPSLATRYRLASGTLLNTNSDDRNA